MIYSGLFVFVAVVVLVIYRDRGVIWGSHAALVWMLPVATGWQMLAAKGSVPVRNYLIYLACLVALAVGIMSGRRFHTSLHYGADSAAGEERFVAEGVWCFLVMMVGLAVYHYSVVGVPIFGNNAEMDRWNLLGSGLMGLPSRAVTVGLGLAFSCAFFSLDLATSRRQRKLLRAAASFGLFAVACSSLASGFKGGLLKTVVVVIIAYGLRGGQSYRSKALLLAPMFAIGLVLAVAVGGQYQSYEHDTVGLLSERSTTYAASVANEAIEMKRDKPPWVSVPTYVHDTKTIMKRYVGLGEYHPVFNESFSAYLRHTTPFSGRFLVPVTPTGPSTMIFNIGSLAPFAYFAVGLGIARVEIWVANGTTLRRRLAGFVLVQVFFGHVASGGMAFGLVNFGIMALLALTSIRLVQRALVAAAASHTIGGAARPATQAGDSARRAVVA